MHRPRVLDKWHAITGFRGEIPPQYKQILAQDRELSAPELKKWSLKPIRADYAQWLPHRIVSSSARTCVYYICIGSSTDILVLVIEPVSVTLNTWAGGNITHTLHVQNPHTYIKIAQRI